METWPNWWLLAIIKWDESRLILKRKTSRKLEKTRKNLSILENIISLSEMNFGERLKEDRVERGHGMESLADKLRNSSDIPEKIRAKMEKGTLTLGRSWIERLENGSRKKVSIEEKQWIARNLNYPEDRYLELSKELPSEDSISELLIRRMDEIGDCHLTCEPATFGVDTSFSPQMLELYMRFLSRSEGKLFLIFRDNRYQTIGYIYLLAYILFAKGGFGKPLEIDALRDSIKMLMEPLHAGRPMKCFLAQQKIKANDDEVLRFLDDRLVIHDTQVRVNIIRNNPFSYYRLGPRDPAVKSMAFWGLGTLEFGELMGSHKKMIVERFKHVPTRGSMFKEVSFLAESTKRFIRYRALEGGVVFPEVKTKKHIDKVCQDVREALVMLQDDCDDSNSRDGSLDSAMDALERRLKDPEDFYWLID